jgi:hypothetical protein
MRSINIRHKKRIKFIKDNLPDFQLIELWEHEFNKMSKIDDHFKDK